MLSLYKDWVELDGIVDEKMENGKWKMGLAIVSLLIYVMKWMSCVVLCLRKKRGVGGVYGNDDWRAHQKKKVCV